MKSEPVSDGDIKKILSLMDRLGIRSDGEVRMQGHLQEAVTCLLDAMRDLVDGQSLDLDFESRWVTPPEYRAMIQARDGEAERSRRSPGTFSI